MNLKSKVSQLVPKSKRCPSEEPLIEVLTEGPPVCPEVVIYEETAFGTTRLALSKAQARAVALRILDELNNLGEEEVSIGQLLSASGAE